MKKMKDKLNETMEFYKGFPKGTYCEVLDEMKKTQVNGWYTSSLPLAEFWQPANLPRINAVLAQHLPELDIEHARKRFECPTNPMYKGKVVGNPSMTDLMILDGLRWKIADEGKFTEYSCGLPVQTCAGWLDEYAKRRTVVLPHTLILRAWIEMIVEAGCSDITVPQFLKTCMEIGYQFLHRTASACYKTNGSDGQKPVLIYQLFYKAGDDAHIQKMEAFKEQLREWARLLRLRNMKFLILSVPITNADEVERRYGHLVKQENARIFEDMKLETIYRFDFDSIEVEDVLAGKEE